jgi:hypothetical protein
MVDRAYIANVVCPHYVVWLFLKSFVSRWRPIFDWNGVCVCVTLNRYQQGTYIYELHEYIIQHCQLKCHVFKSNISRSLFLSLLVVTGGALLFIMSVKLGMSNFTYVILCSSTYFVPLRPFAARDPEGSQSCKVLLLDDICAVGCGIVMPHPLCALFKTLYCPKGL